MDNDINCPVFTASKASDTIEPIEPIIETTESVEATEPGGTTEPVEMVEPSETAESKKTLESTGTPTPKSDGVPHMDYNVSSRDPQMQDYLTPDNDWTDSNASYNKIAHRIVSIAEKQLDSQNASKTLLKEKLSNFFRVFLTVQLIVVSILIAGQIVCRIIWPNISPISDQIIITFITSVFVESLGGIVLMITYAFNSKDEVQITKILSEVIKNFKKGSSDDTH